MRRAAGLGMACMLIGVAAQVATARSVSANSPTLTLVSPASGPPGTTVTYDYQWDAIDCVVALDPLEIDATWQPSGDAFPPGAADGSCSGTISGAVPSGTAPGAITV